MMREVRWASKESPGGLRDLQNILWIGGAPGLGASWPDLVRQRILTSEEARQLKRHESVLVFGPTGVGKSHLAQAFAHEA